MVESDIPWLRATGKNKTRLATFRPSSVRAAIDEAHGGMLGYILDGEEGVG